MRDQLDAGIKLYRESPPEGHAVWVDEGDPSADVVGIEEPEAIAMAMTLERPVSGEIAMDFGDVVLQDGRVFGCTWREWGEIMAARFGGDYLHYYMGEVIEVKP